MVTQLKVVSLNWMRVLRVMRVLKKLRSSNESSNMKILVITFMDSLPTIGQMLFILLLIFYAISILGHTILDSKFGYCNVYPSYNISLGECEALGLPWKNYWHNYDNPLQGLMSTFIMANSMRVGWASLMYAAMDCSDPGVGPIQDHNQYVAFFYLA